MHISDIIFTSASLVHRFSSRFPSLLSRIFNVHFLPFSFVLSMFRFIIYVSSLLQVHRFCLPPPKMVFFSFFFLFRFIFLLYLFLAILAIVHAHLMCQLNCKNRCSLFSTIVERLIVI